MSTHDQTFSETSLDESSFEETTFDRATSEDVAFSDRVAAAARLLAVEPSVQETLDGIVELAVSMVPGCAAAGISLITRREITTAAATDQAVRLGDEMQYELDEGPCLDAVRSEEVVRSDDVVADSRWPRWGPAVTERLGVRSMLCLQLYTTETKHGALNLYATEPGAFSAADQALAGTFAAVAAAALQAAQTEEQLASAVASRTLIGQAQGVIMERYGLSAPNAFSVLSRISQDSNTKLAVVAEQIVATRRIPGIDAPSADASGPEPENG